MLGLLAVIVAAAPFATAALTYAVYGWPVDGRHAFHPKRVALLHVALFDQLMSVRYAPLYLRWTSYYRRAGPPHVFKGIDYGRGRRLDVYAPSATPTTDVQTAELALGAAARASDDDGRRLRPVVLFVYGGAWGYGNREMYGLLASRLVREGLVVVVMDYVLHPHGVVDDMVADVHAAFAWTQTNAAAYGGDPSRITLVGHSAGAHLSVLTTMRHGLPAHAVVGLSGVYSIADHYWHEHSRGVESVSPMHKVMGGHAHFAAHSPSHIVENGAWPPTCNACRAGAASVDAERGAIPKRSNCDGGRERDAAISDNPDDCRAAVSRRCEECGRVPRFVLVHGARDGVVPPSSSARLASALERAGVPVEHVVHPLGQHADFVIDLMREGAPLHDDVVRIVASTARGEGPETRKL